MADSKLSALTAATPAGPDLVYLVQGGNPRRGTAQGIANLATKATVGLGSVDNTSDANKPVSTATQTALDGKADTGAIGSSGLTMTAGVLGRESGTGAPQVYPLGSGLSIVAGVLTVTAPGSGTVTSVGLSVPTGFVVADSPITTSGTLALSFAAGYSLPTTAKQTEWDTDVIVIPVGDETTALTTGTNKVRFRMPYAATLLAVRSNVNTAPTGSTLIVDVNEAGASVLGTKLSIDATETSSTTAASAATITDTGLADDAEISIDIDQIGSTVAGAGLKVYLFVQRA
jgi:hypothetical protein